MVKIEHELWNIKQTNPEFYAAICQKLGEQKFVQIKITPASNSIKFIDKHDEIDAPAAYIYEWLTSDAGDIPNYYLLVTDSQVVEPPIRDSLELFEQHKTLLTKNYLGEWYWSALEFNKSLYTVPLVSLTSGVYEEMFNICNTFEEYQQIRPSLAAHLVSINADLPDFIQDRGYNSISTYYAKYGTFLERLKILVKFNRNIYILDYEPTTPVGEYIYEDENYYHLNASRFCFDYSHDLFSMLSSHDYAKQKLNKRYKQKPMKIPEFKGFPLIISNELFETKGEAETYLNQQIKKYVLPLKSTWGIVEHALNFRYRPDSNLREFSNETKETFGIKLFDYSK